MHYSPSVNVLIRRFSSAIEAYPLSQNNNQRKTLPHPIGGVLLCQRFADRNNHMQPLPIQKKTHYCNRLFCYMRVSSLIEAKPGGEKCRTAKYSLLNLLKKPGNDREEVNTQLRHINVCFSLMCIRWVAARLWE